MKNISGVLKGMKEDAPPSKKRHERYIPTAFLRTVYNTEEDFSKIEKLFDTAQKSLYKVSFNDKAFTSKNLLVTAMALKNSSVNFDEISNLMKKVADESDMCECGKKFVESFNDA